MKRTVHIESKGAVTLHDRHYVASGGEADVFRKGRVAYKIYHDPALMIPEAKINELASLCSSEILVPTEVLRDRQGQAIGFTMPFAENCVPLVKLFSRHYRQEQGFDLGKVAQLIAALRRTIDHIHRHGCLVVDLNEMNVLVDLKHVQPRLIDVDSYQTPSFEATALSEAVRDPRVKGKQFHRGSDWFALAILAFQLYVGVHPYKGRHPDFGPGQWQERMRLGVSVFDRRAQLPVAAGHLNQIPRLHYRWFYDVFVSGRRNPPPALDWPAIPNVVLDRHDHHSLEITTLARFQADIRRIWSLDAGLLCQVGEDLYLGQQKLALSSRDPVLAVQTKRGDVVVATQRDGALRLRDLRGQLDKQVPSQGAFVKDGVLYALIGGRLMLHDFKSFSGRLHHVNSVVGRTSSGGVRIMDGVVFSDALGMTFLLVPLATGGVVNVDVAKLAGSRIIAARATGPWVVGISEYKGDYRQFYWHAERGIVSLTHSALRDVSCVAFDGHRLLAINGTGHLEVRDRDGVITTIADPPMVAGQPLLQSADGVVAAIGKKILGMRYQPQEMAHPA